MDMHTVTIIAALLSGFVGGVGAVAASVFAYMKSDKLERRAKKRDLTYQIFGNRHCFSSPPPTDEQTKHLAISGINQIPIVFFDNKEVLEAYDNCVANISDDSMIALFAVLPKASGMAALVQDRHVKNYISFR